MAEIDRDAFATPSPHLPGPLDSALPSRRVLTEAEETYRRTGNEHHGFLSEATGFLPRIPSEPALPESHRAWDEIAAALPSLWRDAGVRRAVRDLPLLRATENELEDRYVRRASTILAMVAHSWVYSELTEAGPLPAPLEQPWEDTAVRLQRPEPFLHFEDLILANWRLPDPTLPPITENMELLVAQLGIPAEYVFYLVLLELHFRSVRLPISIVRAQEAIAEGNESALEQELLYMIETVRALADEVMIKIDPNPHSVTYVDHILWGALVASFGVSIKKHIPSPGGTASPIFHTLDAFLGRTRYESMLGHEAMALRKWSGGPTSRFIAAIAEGPGADVIHTDGSRRLRGLLQTLADVYAGPRGLITLHRIKAYGFLETAFKVGRTGTLSRIAGTFHDRPWRKVHHELEESRLERELDKPFHPVHARLNERRDASPSGRVKHLVLDVADEGVVYRPGDRCGILPTNSPDLVERTIDALKANGSEMIPLTNAWRLALRPHLADDVKELPLRAFLAYAKLRPLLRDVAKALHAVSTSKALHEVIESRREDQWELWDALEIVASDGYDVTRLWRSEAWQPESLAAILPPEEFRLYSIASPGGAETAAADDLHLAVGTVRYTSRTGAPEPVLRRGTASTFLNEDAVEKTGAIPITVIRPLRFRMPDDDRTPIVLFAAGSGISPMRSFLHHRSSASTPGDAWLFFGIRARDEIHFLDDLLAGSDRGWLNVRLALSGEDDQVEIVAGPDGARLQSVGGTARRIDAVMLDEDNARALWDLLGSPAEGGRGARAYICGQGGFAQSVMTALQTIAARSLGSDAAAADFMRRLVGDRRLMLDVFTTFAPARGPGILGDGLYDASDLVLHNDDDHGYWFVINGNVYDMTEFRHLHPGGRDIVDGSAGLDATGEYRAVLHHKNAEVDAMLAMYKIGEIRRLRLDAVWGIALKEGKFEYVSLHDLFRVWVRFLYLVVEMQNAFAHDLLYLGMQTTKVEAPDQLTPLKLMLFGNTHHRFIEIYYKGVLGDQLNELWRLTVGLCDPDEDIGWMEKTIGGALERHRESVEDRMLRIANLYKEGRDAKDDESFWTRVAGILGEVHTCDSKFLSDVKDVLRAGVQVFERHEQATIEHGEALLTALRGFPELVERYHRDFARLSL